MSISPINAYPHNSGAQIFMIISCLYRRPLFFSQGSENNDDSDMADGFSLALCVLAAALKPSMRRCDWALIIAFRFCREACTRDHIFWHGNADLCLVTSLCIHEM